MTGTIESIRREVVVEVDRATAFDVFTDDMTSWWPSDHHIGSAPIERVVIEPRAGGRWYTRHQDGTETSTGFVTVWDRPDRVVVTWQIGADWKYHPDLVTTLEVRFDPEGESRTRVRLEHRDLDAFGADATAMRGTFDEPGAWTATLEAYATQAGAAA